jgi:hypothetical protein
MASSNLPTPDKSGKRLGDDLDQQYESYTRAAAAQIAASQEESQKQREETRKIREGAIGFLEMQKTARLQSSDGSWSREIGGEEVKEEEEKEKEEGTGGK